MAAVFALAFVWCAPQTAPRGPDPATLHRSCLNACDNVRRLPVCTSGAGTKLVSSLSDVLEAPAEYDGKRVRVRGRLDEGISSSTLMDCDPEECCNSDIHPFVSLVDLQASVSAELAGVLRLESGATLPLRCHSRAGYTVKTYAGWEDRRPLTYGLWDRRSKGEPPADQLVRAYCCPIDVHGQTVLAEGTLEISKQPFSPHRLIDPLLCEAR